MNEYRNEYTAEYEDWIASFHYSPMLWLLDWETDWYSVISRGWANVLIPDKL